MNENKAKLIRLAARLVKDIPLSGYAEDNPKTTPKKILMEHLCQADELRDIAYEIRQIANKLE